MSSAPAATLLKDRPCHTELWSRASERRRNDLCGQSGMQGMMSDADTASLQTLRRDRL